MSAPNKETNRIHYVGAARIMCLYGENNTLLRGRANPAGKYVLSMSVKMATAQAWDAYCKSYDNFVGARGIPGGVLSLGALECISSKFSAWLDQPYVAPKGEKRKD